MHAKDGFSALVHGFMVLPARKSQQQLQESQQLPQLLNQLHQLHRDGTCVAPDITMASDAQKTQQKPQLQL